MQISLNIVTTTFVKYPLLVMCSLVGRSGVGKKKYDETGVKRLSTRFSFRNVIQ